MAKNIFLFFIIVFSVATTAQAWWWSSNDPEKVSVNAYFYYANNQEVFLGKMVGVSACQSAAQNFAYSKKVQNTNWDYICCTIRKGSSCYEKIR